MSARRIAARLLTAVVLVGAGVPLVAGTAWACSCHGYGDGSEQAQYRGLAREADVIYTGVITEERRDPQPGTGPQPPPAESYTVRVEEGLKGGASGTREIKTNGGGGASCGIDLESGRRALVIEFVGDGQVGLCDGTSQDRVDERADIVRDELRRRTLADTGPPGWLGAFTVLLAAAALATRQLGSRRGAASRDL